MHSLLHSKTIFLPTALPPGCSLEGSGHAIQRSNLHEIEPLPLPHCLTLAPAWFMFHLGSVLHVLISDLCLLSLLMVSIFSPGPLMPQGCLHCNSLVVSPLFSVPHVMPLEPSILLFHFSLTQGRLHILSGVCDIVNYPFFTVGLLQHQ